MASFCLQILLQRKCIVCHATRWRPNRWPVHSRSLLPRGYSKSSTLPRRYIHNYHPYWGMRRLHSRVLLRHWWYPPGMPHGVLLSTRYWLRMAELSSRYFQWHDRSRECDSMHSMLSWFLLRWNKSNVNYRTMRCWILLLRRVRFANAKC